MKLTQSIMKVMLTFAMLTSVTGCTDPSGSGSASTDPETSPTPETTPETTPDTTPDATPETTPDTTEGTGAQAPGGASEVTYPETVEDLPGGKNIDAIYMGLWGVLPYLRNYDNGIVPPVMAVLPDGVDFGSYADGKGYYIEGFSSVEEMYEDLENYVTKELIQENRTGSLYDTSIKMYAEKDGKVYLDPACFAHGWSVYEIADTAVIKVDEDTCYVPGRRVTSEDGTTKRPASFCFKHTEDGWRLSEVKLPEYGDPEYAQGIGKVKVLVSGLNSRKEPSTSAEKLAAVNEGDVYTYYKYMRIDGYSWYMIEENRWIADNGSWLEEY